MSLLMMCTSQHSLSVLLQPIPPPTVTNCTVCVLLFPLTHPLVSCFFSPPCWYSFPLPPLLPIDLLHPVRTHGFRQCPTLFPQSFLPSTLSLSLSHYTPRISSPNVIFFTYNSFLYILLCSVFHTNGFDLHLPLFTLCLTPLFFLMPTPPNIPGCVAWCPPSVVLAGPASLFPL